MLKSARSTRLSTQNPCQRGRQAGPSGSTGPLASHLGPSPATAAGPHGSATQWQGRCSAGRCSPAASPSVARRGGASVLNARSRTDWHNGAGPTAWGSARPRRHARRRGRRRQVRPSPRRWQPLASANDGGQRGGTASGVNRGMAWWCGSSTLAKRVGELGSSSVTPRVLALHNLTCIA